MNFYSHLNDCVMINFFMFAELIYFTNKIPPSLSLSSTPFLALSELMFVQSSSNICARDYIRPLSP